MTQAISCVASEDSGILYQCSMLPNTCQFMIITVNGHHKVHLLFLDVCKHTSISHEGHHNIGGRATIHTHSNDTENILSFIVSAIRFSSKKPRVRKLSECVLWEISSSCIDIKPRCTKATCIICGIKQGTNPCKLVFKQ